MRFAFLIIATIHCIASIVNNAHAGGAAPVYFTISVDGKKAFEGGDWYSHPETEELRDKYRARAIRRSGISLVKGSPYVGRSDDIHLKGRIVFNVNQMTTMRLSSLRLIHNGVHHASQPDYLNISDENWTIEGQDAAKIVAYYEKYAEQKILDREAAALWTMRAPIILNAILAILFTTAIIAAVRWWYANKRPIQLPVSEQDSSLSA